MTEQRASGGMQAVRVVMALVGVLLGAALLLGGQWLTGAVLLAGGVAALIAFRRGTYDRQAARDYVAPRLVGGVIGLVVFVVAAVVGLLD